MLKSGVKFWRIEDRKSCFVQLVRIMEIGLSIGYPLSIHDG
jgi:hypothetical protein